MHVKVLEAIAAHAIEEKRSTLPRQSHSHYVLDTQSTALRCAAIVIVAPIMIGAHQQPMIGRVRKRIRNKRHVVQTDNLNANCAIKRRTDALGGQHDVANWAALGFGATDATRCPSFNKVVVWSLKILHFALACRARCTPIYWVEKTILCQF